MSNKSGFPLDQNCFVTSITLTMLKKYGFDVLDWDPLIVRDAFEGGFHVQNMPQRMFDKLNCGLSLLGTSLYTDSIEGFLAGTACMANIPVDGAVAPFVSFRQCAWGVWEYMNMNGDMDKNEKPSEKFCPDVIAYIQKVARLVGVSTMPNWLAFAGFKDSDLPDMAEDADIFEMYMARQRDYIDATNQYVNSRQGELEKELLALAAAGLIAQDTEKLQNK